MPDTHEYAPRLAVTEQLEQLVDTLDQELPRVKAESPVSLSSTLSPAEFDSLTASW